MELKILRNLKRVIAAFMLTVFVVSMMLPFISSAEEKEQKVVRVGWYNSTFCYYDSFGRRCGVDYEYHQKIAAYTGWKYEYVEDSWPNLFQMLQKGEIDLLSDVSYKPEREEYMYFADLPMGTEAYYIYVASDNSEITANNLASFNGKRIGVNKGSYQEGLLEEWAEKYKLNVDIVSMTETEDESMEKLTSKEIDGYATIFNFDYNRDAIPVSRIGGSDYYYAVSKSRPDLLEELNMAMAEIQDNDPYFNEKLSKERLINKSTNALLTPQQEDWLADHGEITIGYRRDYFPFCNSDDENGEVTGALKDYLAHALNNLNSKELKFKTVPYDNTEAVIEALRAGEIDCAFPVNLSTYDAEQKGVMLTDPAMETEMNAVMRVSDRHELSDDTKITFAVNANMVNVETFIKQYYPKSQFKSFDGLPACYDAVADGDVDCVLVSNYRIAPAENTFKEKDLYSVPTGEAMSISFAVRKTDSELYSVMNKTVLATRSSDMNAALASYMYKDYSKKVSFMEYLKEHWLIVISVLTVLFAMILFLLNQKLKAERLANKQKHLLEEAEEISDLHQTVSSLLDNVPGVYFTKDAETGEYLACNQMFADYVHKKNPSEVIGFTSADFFDGDKIKNFAKDDQTALSMDEPLIYYDTMNDVDGTPTKVKVTKQKYTDTNGRLCILGIVQDVSDTLRISRDKASTKESYEKARSNGIIFTHIAQALAQGYKMLYYVDLVTEEFIEYHSDAENGGLVEVRRGWHFFEEGEEAAEKDIYFEDREAVVLAMKRKTLVAVLDQNPVFMMTYRLNTEQHPIYVSMKITRMQDDERYIIMSVTDIDEQMKQRQVAQRIQEEQTAYNRISALAGEFLCIYIIEPETVRYREYSSVAGLDSFAMPEEGQNFFYDFRKNFIRIVHKEEQNRVFTALTMENVLDEVANNGIFTLTFRIMLDDEPRYVQLKAALVDEKDGKRLVVGVNDIDAQVRQEEEYGRRLAQARIEANIDALTGVKNRNAYRVYEERLNAQIEMNRAPEFAIVLLDVNDLKKVNDNEGHKAGDQFLRDACKIICTTFKRSPVFRVGGDEFVALCQGDDYNRLDELTDFMNEHNEEAVRNGGIVIAMGVSRYNNDEKAAQVYERADQRMYENKSYLKEKKKLRGQ